MYGLILIYGLSVQNATFYDIHNPWASGYVIEFLFCHLDYGTNLQDLGILYFHVLIIT
jgi:hypothetical protein